MSPYLILSCSIIRTLCKYSLYQTEIFAKANFWAEERYMTITIMVSSLIMDGWRELTSIT